ncbi:hypothetical protein AWB71_05331 [Caballeronia peredens]|nr:hypothetical protein AWB71_05331 [Caballeronia peredens]
MEIDYEKILKRLTVSGSDIYFETEDVGKHQIATWRHEIEYMHREERVLDELPGLVLLAYVNGNEPLADLRHQSAYDLRHIVKDAEIGEYGSPFSYAIAEGAICVLSQIEFEDEEDLPEELRGVDLFDLDEKVRESEHLSDEWLDSFYDWSEAEFNEDIAQRVHGKLRPYYENGADYYPVHIPDIDYSSITNEELINELIEPAHRWDNSQRMLKSLPIEQIYKNIELFDEDDLSERYQDVNPYEEVKRLYDLDQLNKRLNDTLPVSTAKERPKLKL